MQRLRDHIRVAIVGGDAQLNITLAGAVVTAFPSAGDGGNGRSRPAIAAISQGRFDIVVLLTRWLGHSLYGTVRAACARTHVRVVVITGGKSATVRAIERALEGGAR